MYYDIDEFSSYSFNRPRLKGNFPYRIKGFTAGTSVILRRIYPLEYMYYPDTFISGITPTKAWLTVKADYQDDDTRAIIQKVVTLAEDATQGLIRYYGNSSVVTMRFYLSPTDTNKIEPEQTYYYNVKYLTSDGRLFSPESGTMVADIGVTQASS